MTADFGRRAAVYSRDRAAPTDLGAIYFLGQVQQLPTYVGEASCEGDDDAVLE